MYPRCPGHHAGLLPDGILFHERAAQTIRSQQRGHRNAEGLLRDLGAPAVDADDPAGWLAAALTHIGARRIHHPGNHRYTVSHGRRRAQELAAAHTAARHTRRQTHVSYPMIHEAPVVPQQHALIVGAEHTPPWRTRVMPRAVGP